MATMLSRRHFLSSFGGPIGVFTIPKPCWTRIFAKTAGLGAVLRHDRTEQAYRVRCDAAWFQKTRERTAVRTNGDDNRFPSGSLSYSKALPHDNNGEPDSTAYAALLRALNSGKSEDFLRIPLEGVVYLTNPQSAYTFGLQGADSHHLDLIPPPSISSAAAAAEMVELYWHAVLRDIAFNQYQESAPAKTACEDLTRCTEFLGPKRLGAVDASVLFRGNWAEDLAGPYISQFLYARIPHGVYSLEQRFRMPAPGIDYLTTYDEWLAIQRGGAPRSDVHLEAERRFIRTGRDLARYVHRDYSFQAFLNAALFLTNLGDEYVALNPYVRRGCPVTATMTPIVTEVGFCTFGAPAVLSAVTAVANLALHASWRQKWLVHRRLRPEEFGERVDSNNTHPDRYPVHKDVLSSPVRDYLPSRRALLPQAYPEGAPTHPSYPAGHAAVAGACATILKAFFRQDANFPSPVEPSEDGLTLIPASDHNLTVAGEINKLASNISFGRNFAGVHYRSDAIGGIRLGELVAIAYLRDLKRCLTEDFDGFEITTFGGKVITI